MEFLFGWNLVEYLAIRVWLVRALVSLEKFSMVSPQSAPHCLCVVVTLKHPSLIFNQDDPNGGVWGGGSAGHFATIIIVVLMFALNSSGHAAPSH
ncbi:hypothetical protein AMATHDRAFT_7257 [Amanita thiersii Skay4041]|uniref:Uncharacterized protein n=1 Tax=Amanita thiersii Skay4041 TaxID=703135 RepID=A0A2A9N8V9_9AGAR|nr:hypothetical protein AMATHDRAFT_7257 [Amanita thiersii Skay4041]